MSAVGATVSAIEPRARPPAGRLACLNAVRAALAIGVLFYHLSGTIALDKYFGVDAFVLVFGGGGVRVPFFFALSGFLLAYLHRSDVGRPERLPGFLRKRLLRIYPTYWIILSAVIGASLLLPGLRGKVPADPWALLQTYLLVPQSFESGGGPTGAPMIIVAWTLHFELAFYGVIAAFIFSRLAGWVLVAALVINALDCRSGSCGFYRGFLANPYLTHFAIGAGAAWLSRRLPPLPNASSIAWGALFAFVAIAVGAPGNVDIRHMADPNIYFALLAGIVLLGLVNAEAARPPSPSPAWVRWLSDSSYALYLLHFPLISLLCKVLVGAGLSGTVGATVAFFVISALCVGAAIAFHRVIEKPLLRRLRRATGDSRGGGGLSEKGGSSPNPVQ